MFKLAIFLILFSYNGYSQNSLYTSINSKSWQQILKEDTLKWRTPYTVHLPIQPVHSPDFIHIDCALNAIRRRVYDDVTQGNARAKSNRETFIVQFAFDNPAFVPDFKRGKLSLAENKFPVVTGEYILKNILYKVEYSCNAIDENQSLLWINVKVINRGKSIEKVHVRAKINFQLEKSLFDYHYKPYNWDASKWLTYSGVKLVNDNIYNNDQLIGKVESKNMNLIWEEEAHFTNTDFDKKFGADSLWFSPKMRLNDIQDVILAQSELIPGEEKAFSIALLTNYEKITSSNLSYLEKSSANKCKTSALESFNKQTNLGNTQMIFPTGNWQDMFTALQISTLQMLVKYPDKEFLVPTQGGSSERFFVWVWEAVQMLRPMLRLGQFEPVKKSLDYIFTLQDGGFPPQGNFTTLEGAVGTTGPKWICSTGAALALACEYYIYSKDTAFLLQYLPKIVKAANWIIGEVKATRKLNPDGLRPLYYGLMPFGVGTDGDVGHVVAMSDAYSFWGLEKTVKLLEYIKNPKATEFRKELELYRSDLIITLKGLSRPDGFIDRKIVTNESGEEYFDGFDNVCSVAQLAYTDVIDPESEIFQRFITYFENNKAVDYFIGNIDEDKTYLGIGERDWQYIYLSTGQWKKAFAANRTNLKYGMTNDTYQVQERFSRSNPAFTPWQPNGSGNGKVLEMMINSLYFENPKGVTLLGGIPFEWLQKNKKTSLRNLYTSKGIINIDVMAQNSKICILTISSSSKNAISKNIRIPEYFNATSSDKALVNKGNGIFELLEPVDKLVFEIEVKYYHE